MYAATLKKVRELVDESGDPDMVETIVLQVVAQDRERFVAYRSLTLNTFEYFRDMMEVPAGGWGYALVMETTADPRVADTLDYWLRCWRDAELAQDEPAVWRARQKLEHVLEVVAARAVPVE